MCIRDSDNLYIDDVIASLAGDNVVLVITPNEIKAKEVAEIIHKNIQ